MKFAKFFGFQDDGYHFLKLQINLVLKEYKNTKINFIVTSFVLDIQCYKNAKQIIFVILFFFFILLYQISNS